MKYYPSTTAQPRSLLAVVSRFNYPTRICVVRVLYLLLVIVLFLVVWTLYSM